MTIAPNAAPQRVAVALSRAEVFYLARLMRLPKIPGVDTSWLTAADGAGVAGDIVHLMAAVGLGLVARGYMQVLPPQDEQVRVALNPVVATLLKGCTASQDSLFISTVSASAAPFVANLHWTGQFGIAHTGPQPGVHLFEAIETRDKVVAAAMQALHVETQHSVASGPAEAVLATALLAAREPALAQDRSATVAALAQGGLSSALAQPLATAMATPDTVFASVLSWHRLDNSQASIKFMSVIASPQACFIATARSTVPEHVTVRAASADDVRQWLLTPPAITD